MNKHILIVGGGFAGLWAALAAAREAEITGGGIAITLASRDDHLTLRPRLYEQAPARFREPLRRSWMPSECRYVWAAWATSMRQAAGLRSTMRAARANGSATTA